MRPILVPHLRRLRLIATTAIYQFAVRRGYNSYRTHVFDSYNKSCDIPANGIAEHFTGTRLQHWMLCKTKKGDDRPNRWEMIPIGIYFMLRPHFQTNNMQIYFYFITRLRAMRGRKIERLGVEKSIKAQAEQINDR